MKDTWKVITNIGKNRRLILPAVLAVGLSTIFVSSVAWVVLNIPEGVNGYGMRYVVIDTDAGVDDAVAILMVLGDPSISVEAITCVAGNTLVDNVVTNVLKLLKLMGKLEQVPVYSGTDYGLVNIVEDSGYFGKDGLMDVDYTYSPPPNIRQKEHAASALARIVNENPGRISVLCLGPLTNIALAANINPNFFKLVKEIIVLGGSVKGLGNAAPGIEFNFYTDPVAASVVFDRSRRSDATVTLLPMETIVDHPLNSTWRWTGLASVKSKQVNFIDRIEKATLKVHPEYAPYDTYAACYLLNPVHFATYSQRRYVSVEYTGQQTKGAVLVDYYNITGNRPNANIVTEVSVDVLQDTMKKTLS